MAVEEWFYGTWNDPRWRTPQHQGSSSLSNPRAGWMWHDGKQHSPWLQGNLPVDVTSNDPQQSSDERSEVIPSLDETEDWREAGLLDPAKAKPKNRLTSGAGDSRREPDEVQSAVEEKVKEYKPQENDRVTSVPRAGALQEVVSSHQKTIWCPRDGGPRGK